MTRECGQSWCHREFYAKGYCFAHYRRARDGRDMDMPLQRRGDYEAKFWERVEKSEGCWTWTGGTAQSGYGVIRYDGRGQLAHRISYTLHFTPIPDGLQVDHKCHNPACVNPDHLRLATDALNRQNLAGAYVTSKSGIRGVSWSQRRKKWIAQASLGGKQFYLGGFALQEEAARIVIEWRREHMPYSLMDQEKVTT
jgi:hypothetical protein